MPTGVYKRSIEHLLKKLNWKDYDCWIWPLGINFYGYPTKSADGHRQMAHRLVRELLIGEISLGLEPDHLCRNPGCVNPLHTELVTHKENIRRGLVQTKLTYKQVKRIRRKSKESNFAQSKIAKHYKVSCQTISNVINHKTWKRKLRKEGEKQWKHV